MVIETGKDHDLTQLCAAIDTNLMIQFTIHSILEKNPKKILGQNTFKYLSNLLAKKCN